MSPARRVVQTAPVPAWAMRAYDERHGRDVNFEPIGWEQAVADPALLRAVYDAAAPFDGADELDGRPVHRFAWHYRTLEGHLERGQMDDEVRKCLEDGCAEFRIAAYSQRGQIENPIVRTGFALSGRATQSRFYARASRRMRILTAERTVDRAP